LRDVLAARLEIRETDGPDTVRTKWQRGVAEVLGVESGTTKALVLALWLGFEVGDAPAVHSVRHDPEGLSDRAAGYLAEYLENLARQNPVVMLLEDLHWADESSLSWFDGAAATLRERRVLVVGTARPALFERHPHWGEGLEHHSRLSLERLSRRESRELVAEILQKADRVPVALFDLIVEVAEGNPFYVEELVKWLIEVEVITRHGEIWHVHEERVASVEVPPTLKGLLQARLDALPPHERVVAQRASVIGRVFWDDAVDYLAGASPAPASGALSTNDALNGLRTREVVQRRERSAFDGTTEFLFKHALLRDVAYDGVLKAHRRTFHSLAARWLEQTTGRSRRGDEYAGLIAEHYDHAGDPSAPGWYLQAGRKAAAVHANPEAARLLTRGLELAPESAPTLRFDLLLAREAILDRAGDRVAQEADFLAMEVVVAGIDDPVRRSRLLVRRSNWAFARSDYAASAAAARESATQARAAGRADLEAEGRLWEGKSLVWAGQNDEALAILDGALQQARAVGAYRLVGECLRYLSTLANNRSDFALARQRAAEALDVYRQHEDLEGESVALSQLGTVCYNEGRHDEARAYIEQSIPAFRLSGHRYREAVAIGNLATVLLQEGYFATGRRMMMESLELCRRLGDREGQATDMGVLADLARATGDWRRARSEYGAALAATQEIGFARLASDLELGLALVCVAEGNTAEALDRASRAVELGATADSPMSEARARLASGYVFRHAGQLDDAAATLIAALGLADQLDLDYLVIESRAILADVTRLRGDDDASVELVTEVVPNLTTALLMGCLQPGELLLALHRVLAPAHDARTQGALATAKAYLDELSARIGDDTLRTGFLERVPAHVELARLISG